MKKQKNIRTIQIPNLKNRAMKIEKGQITILVNREFTEITLHDDKASTDFARVRLTPEQLCSALSRLSQTDCEIEVFSLDRVGKKHENQTFEFEIPRKLSEYNRDNEELKKVCEKAMQNSGLTEWKSDHYYGSQNSFFAKDGKNFARVTIRRYV